jgi:lysophospholipase L1-like esterase
MIRAIILSSFLLFLTSVNAQEITAFGTSFSYGEDVNRNEAFPVKLQEMLNSKGQNVKVYNFSVSGDTTFDLLNRLDRIPKDSKIVIFEYAIGNDQRSGIKRDVTELNAGNAIKKIIASNKQVILLLRGLHKDRLNELISRWTPFIQETGISYISIFQPASKNAATNPAYYHPNPAFHIEIAEQLVDPTLKLLAKK